MMTVQRSPPAGRLFSLPPRFKKDFLTIMLRHCVYTFTWVGAANWPSGLINWKLFFQKMFKMQSMYKYIFHEKSSRFMNQSIPALKWLLTFCAALLHCWRYDTLNKCRLVSSFDFIKARTRISWSDLPVKLPVKLYWKVCIPSSLGYQYFLMLSDSDRQRSEGRTEPFISPTSPCGQNPIFNSDRRIKQ